MKKNDVLNFFTPFLDLHDEKIHVDIGEENEDFVIVYGVGEVYTIINKLNELKHHLKPGSLEYENQSRGNRTVIETANSRSVYIKLHNYEEVSFDSLEQAMRLSDFIYSWILEEAEGMVCQFSARQY